MLLKGMKTKEQLAKLNDDELFQYFSKHAGYMKDAPASAKYTIRIDGRSIHSDDSAKLFEEFKKLCRA